MNDDTRDIAIRADESGKSAHKRLDTINGQIRRLGESHEKMREDFADATTAVVANVHDAKLEIRQLKTTVSHALKVAAVVTTAVLTIATGLTVYAIEHIHSLAPSPPASASQHSK